MRLLLVDDDPDFLLEMKRRLEELGREIEVAQTPVQAIWLLERQPFEAVVCDLRLGDADGRHLLEVVRDRWPRVARVLITGFGDEILDGETWPAAQAVVFKPCDAERLAALLSELPADAPLSDS
jgi:ActR/RegA family two-component response regulator